MRCTVDSPAWFLHRLPLLKTGKSHHQPTSSGPNDLMKQSFHERSGNLARHVENSDILFLEISVHFDSPNGISEISGRMEIKARMIS